MKLLDKAKEIREKFISSLEKTLQNKIILRNDISNNVYEFEERNLFIYVAVISGANTNSVSWRIAENTITKIIKNTTNYVIVFLEKSDMRGYVVDRRDVEHYMKQKIWQVTEGIKNKGTISVNKKRFDKERNKFLTSHNEIAFKIKNELEQI